MIDVDIKEQQKNLLVAENDVFSYSIIWTMMVKTYMLLLSMQ